jgi:transcription antitermination factor NusA-like protein
MRTSAQEGARMQTPFDAFCLRSNVLCKSCDRKIRSGEYTETDLEISRFLTSESEGIHQLADLEFKKSMIEGEYLILVLGKNQSLNFLAQGRKFIRDLSKKYGKRVKLLEEGQTVREFLEGLFAPAKILALNTVWLPDGTTETKVILGRDVHRKKSEIDALKRLAKTIKGIDIRVQFG